VLFHAGLGISGGYVGVDVFFVISGFLITGIILRGIETDSFSVAGFWERRVRRIFPALFVTVAVTLGAGYWLLLPRQLEELGESSIAQAALLANVYFWRDTGYFSGPAELKPLLHTWSLAVEEQFYLFFPLLLVVFRNRSRNWLCWTLIILTSISFALSMYGT
jgi:peptidoglycan/LPS O-acetylase OafA/YrhL